MTKPTDGWMLYDDATGKCIGRGTGYTETQPGETLVYSLDPVNALDAIAHDAADVKRGRLMDVEAMKSSIAYATKATQAREILAGEPYDALRHDFIEIEVRRCGCTPLEASEAIMVALRRDTLAQEDARVELRELLKS
ncbi:hypothetical protein [uncultured Paraglaciecola sp.]|uniref:hypothetical protein n=1 Tax=uncultured Paraglaciecola sp. TaxID=1765024 RepID=UPI00262A188A|nr:hypothetical protein [uncultured Paraglaciecola sp.]